MICSSRLISLSCYLLIEILYGQRTLRPISSFKLRIERVRANFNDSSSVLVSASREAF